MITLEEIDEINTATDMGTGKKYLFIDSLRIFTDEFGWECLRDSAIELLEEKPYEELETNIEVLVKRIEKLEEGLNDYIDKFGKLDGGKEDE